VLVRVRCRASILGQATAVWIVHVVLLQRLVLHDEQRRVRVCREGRCDDNREGEGEGEIEIVALGMRYESASTFSIVPASYCPVSHELQSLDLFLGGGKPVFCGSLSCGILGLGRGTFTPCKNT
jgi:hypothetical protein